MQQFVNANNVFISFTLEEAMKAQTGSTGLALLFLYLTSALDRGGW
jgi:hypothetical protein